MITFQIFRVRPAHQAKLLWPTSNHKAHAQTHCYAKTELALNHAPQHQIDIQEKGRLKPNYLLC